MKTQQSYRIDVRRIAVVLVCAACLLAGGAVPAAHAADLRVNFAFGGAARTASTTARLTGVPGKTVIAVKGTLNALPITPSVSIPVIIDLIAPDGVVAGSLSTAALPAVPVPYAFLLPPTYMSDFGCPRSWSVRIRSASGAAPPVAVSGTHTISFFVPGSGFPQVLPAIYNVDMEGGSINLGGGGASTQPVLAGHDPVFLGAANRSLIEKTEGRFRIRAKWDTDLFQCSSSPQTLNVSLRKPDAAKTLAAAQTAFSLTTSRTPSLDFIYNVTPADASLAGSWGLRIVNANTTPCCTLFCSGRAPVRIANFDIENLLFPSFQSTFEPRCSEAVGSFEVTPESGVVSVGEAATYAFTWTVPEELNWHDLQFLDFRIRDGADTVIAVRFDEASRTFSVLNEASGRAHGGFLAGSDHQLQSSAATLNLAETSVVASGPTSPVVTLNLALSFKPQAAGRTFDVEVAASDDEGGEPQFYDLAGTLTVNPLH